MAPIEGNKHLIVFWERMGASRGLRSDHRVIGDAKGPAHTSWWEGRQCSPCGNHKKGALKQGSICIMPIPV